MSRADFLLLFALLLAVAPLAARAQSVDVTPTNAAAVAPDANAPALPPSPAFSPGGPGAGNSSPQDDIYDIRPPFFFLHSWPWLWITLAAAGALALLILLWTRFKPHRLLSAKSAYELALEKLEKARAMLREDNAMPYAVLVSETIRGYLGQRFEAPSTRRTTDEFLRLMEADRNTPLAEHRTLLRDFLQSCDLVKFARYQPTLAELEEVQQRAFTFVTATKPAAASSRRNGARP